MERWIRWLAVVPVALTAATIVQIGSAAVIHSVLMLVFGYPDWLGSASRILASPLMGSVLVSTVWCVAPQAKMRFAALALFVLIIWGGRLTLAAILSDGSFFSSLIGLAGVTGGLAAFGLIRSRDSFRPGFDEGRSWRVRYMRDDG
jgi:hypothetical protein